MNKQKIMVGISLGDINGIGIEIILKTFKDNRMLDFCTPVIYGSNRIISYHRKILNYHDININLINSIKEAKPKNINLLNISKEEISIKIGSNSEVSGEFAFKSLEKASASLQKKEIDVLVTSPINKFSIQKIKPDFLGHTEFLEKKFVGNSLMIMVSDVMKIAFVTGHIPISDIKNHITESKIIATTKTLSNSLIKDFQYRRPKIAILGLNPHAGENGMLGKEEKEIINPAIKKLKDDGILAFGPYPADSFFSQKNLSLFDGVLAMYHDQGLAPFKALSFYRGVNYTAGLNVIRTSPVHGTAYEIAGKGIANEKSFRESIFLACDIFKKRSEYQELNLKPLKIKSKD